MAKIYKYIVGAATINFTYDTGGIDISPTNWKME
jgi:hypothetical protein